LLTGTELKPLGESGNYAEMKKKPHNQSVGGGVRLPEEKKNTKSMPILEEGGVNVVGSRVDFVESEIHKKFATLSPPPVGAITLRAFFSVQAQIQRSRLIFPDK
jgi:hypothetical protein